MTGATAAAAGEATNFSGRSSANGSEDGVTSTATNSLSHGTHRELPTVCKGYNFIYLFLVFFLLLFLFICLFIYGCGII